jgi:hypothetical protein
MIPHPIIRRSHFNLDLPGKELDVDLRGRARHRARDLCRTHAVESPAAVVGSEQAQGIPALKQGKYVAILPLKQVGDQKTLGYVADGIQEALAAKLFQLKEVHLASASRRIEAPLPRIFRLQNSPANWASI